MTLKLALASAVLAVLWTAGLVLTTDNSARAGVVSGIEAATVATIGAVSGAFLAWFVTRTLGPALDRIPYWASLMLRLAAAIALIPIMLASAVLALDRSIGWNLVPQTHLDLVLKIAASSFPLLLLLSDSRRPETMASRRTGGDASVETPRRSEPRIIPLQAWLPTRRTVGWAFVAGSNAAICLMLFWGDLFPPLVSIAVGLGAASTAMFLTGPARVALSGIERRLPESMRNPARYVGLFSLVAVGSGSLLLCLIEPRSPMRTATMLVTGLFPLLLLAGRSSRPVSGPRPDSLAPTAPTVDSKPPVPETGNPTPESKSRPPSGSVHTASRAGTREQADGDGWTGWDFGDVPVPRATQTPSPPPRPDRGVAFISHSSRDLAACEEIVREIEAAGFRCWYADRDLSPGSAGYHQRILEAIGRSWLVIVLVSDSAVDSPHVKNELEESTNLKKPFLPIHLAGFSGELKDVRYFLKRFQAIRMPAPHGKVTRAIADLWEEAAR